MDSFWKEHEVWMRTKHSMGPQPNAVGGPQLFHFYVAKGAEMVDASAKPPVPTGNILYILIEIYLEAAGIGLHMEQGSTEKGEWFGKLLAYNAKYGKHIDVGTTVNFTGLSDTVEFASPSLYKPGDPCVHAIWSAPPSEEAAIDAFWKEHEAWMRATHDLKRDGDDSERPRLTSFNIRKGAEMEDALAQSPVPTGNILYILSESYAALSGIGKHMELAPFMDKLMELQAKYGKHLDVGSTSIFTHLGK